MASGKEIRGKIKSFENTKKITKAMELVSASKMRKAQDRMRAARPYADKVRNITANLAQANPEYTPAFMKKHSGTGQVGVIVVTTDKGLCGGLNTNILRATTNKLKELEAQGVKAQAVAIGNKGVGFLNRIGAKVVTQVTQLGDQPHIEAAARGPAETIFQQRARASPQHAVAERGDRYRAGHDKEQARIPLAEDVEESQHHRRLGHAAEAEADPEQQSGQERDDNFHVRGLRAHGATHRPWPCRKP